jgi:transglutaminase-like putative cysteine protease
VWTRTRHRRALGTLLLIACAAVTLAGCGNNLDNLRLQARDEIKGIISTNDTQSSERTPPEEIQEPALINGEISQPVAVPTDLGTTQSFDTSLAEQADMITYTASYKVTVGKSQNTLLEKLPWGHKSTATITCLIPKTIAKRQDVLGIQFSVQPKRVFDLGNNRYAEFVVDNPKQDFTIQITSKLKLLRYDLATAQKNPDATPPGNLNKYLKDEKYLEVTGPSIQAAAKRLQGTTELDTIKKIYDFVLADLTYDNAKAQSGDLRAIGAARALTIKTGVCVEYSDLFVALCRAKGIPARCIGGIPTVKNNSTKGHAWAEVYIKGLGWVPFDPTWGETKAATFYELKPTYIYLTDIRNDEAINNSDIYGCEYTGTPIDGDFSIAIDSARTKYLNGILGSINTKKSELAQLKSQLDAQYAQINTAKTELDQLKIQLSQLRGNIEGDITSNPQAYNGLVKNHNELIKTYNQKVADYNKKIAAYESVRKVYEVRLKEENAVIEQYNRLN